MAIIVLQAGEYGTPTFYDEETGALFEASGQLISTTRGGEEVPYVSNYSKWVFPGGQLYWVSRENALNATLAGAHEASYGELYPGEFSEWRPTPKVGWAPPTGYTIIARASNPEELKRTAPLVSTLSRGQKGMVVVDTPLAGLFDLVWAEQLIGEHLVPQGAKVLDCYSYQGKGYVEFEVTGTPVIPLLIAIAAVLLALGILVTAIAVAVLVVTTPEAVKWIALAAGAIAVTAVAVVVVVKSKKRVPA